MADLREKRGIKRICLIGYCYGAPISIHYGKGDAVSAFATAHGKIRVPDDIEPLVRPGLFICADNDFAFPDQARLQVRLTFYHAPDPERYLPQRKVRISLPSPSY